MIQGSPLYKADYTPSGVEASKAIWAGDNIFSYAIAALGQDGVRVYWQLQPTLPAEGNRFTVYRNNDRGNGTWEQIGDPVFDTWTFLDSTVQLTGKFPYIVYKIRIQNDRVDAESSEIYLYGGLTPRQRNLAKAILRRQALYARHNPVLQGYLLKRKHTGVRCSCVDPSTKLVLNSDCTNCFGTGFIAGYWNESVTQTLVATTELSAVPVFDPNAIFGTTTKAIIKVKMSGLPPVGMYDVWVHSQSNNRFYIVDLKVSAEVGGLPVQYDAAMQLANYKDIIYTYRI